MADVDASIGQRTLTGLSSGEGLIWAVRDPTAQDPGIGDQRLLVIEPEFASVLKASGREISTLSPTLRCAWDGRPLAILTRTAPARATSAHIALIGHITQTELRRNHHDRALQRLPQPHPADRLPTTAPAARRRPPRPARRHRPAPACSPRLTNTPRPPARSASTPTPANSGITPTNNSPNPGTGSSARSPPAPKRTRSGSRSSTRSPTVPSRSARRTCTPRSRCTTTPPDPRAGHSNAQQARCSPSRSTRATTQPGRPDPQPDQRHPQAQPARRSTRPRPPRPPHSRPSDRHQDRHRRPARAALDRDHRHLTGLLLLSYPTPRCRPTTAPPCWKSAALNRSAERWPSPARIAASRGPRRGGGPASVGHRSRTAPASCGWGAWRSACVRPGGVARSP